VRNINLIFNIILTIAVIILFILFFKKDTGTSTADKSKKEEVVPVKIEEKSATIVYVNSDSLFEHYDYFKDNQAQAEKERKNLEASIQSKLTAFQTEVDEFKSKAQYMTQEQGMAKQQELMEKEQKLAEYRDAQSDNILKKDQDRADNALKRVTDYLKNHYGSTKYTYILGYSRGGGILFSRDSLDITREVIEGLNKEYKAEKK
jgi:outer membrane protein